MGWSEYETPYVESVSLDLSCFNHEEFKYPLLPMVRRLVQIIAIGILFILPGLATVVHCDRYLTNILVLN